MKLKNFSDYEIDIDLGTVYSYKRNCKIGSLNPDGYVSLTLHSDDGFQKTVKLHRVIWETANGEIPKGYDIHHIDKNRQNNSISNLELIHCSKHRSEHIKGDKNPNYGKYKQCACYALDGTLLKIYPSVQSTEIDGFYPSNVSHCCNGDCATYKGYIWKFMG